MKLLYSYLFLLISLSTLHAKPYNPPLSPFPAHVETAEGTRKLHLIDTTRKRIKFLPIPKDAFEKSIDSPERYILKITADAVTIMADTEVGKFRGQQTLEQLFMIHADHSTATPFAEVPLVTIKDYPRYKWRGFMLDDSRFFCGMKEVKNILDSMAAHKMNRFHWHLTDSQGWRIEIKKYPKLTTIGAMGNYDDPKAPIQFYTQEEIKEIVAYAKARHIVVIPEIDMPGHASAAMRAYPEFSGGGNEKYPDFTFNPASEKTEAFLLDILKEVKTLFPEAPVLHYGGDECHFGWDQWIKLPEVKALMKKEGYTKLQQVEHHFNRKMAKRINELGFTVGGWDEVSKAGLDKDKTLLFWWRHGKTQQLAETLKEGYEVVLCPRIPCYFDFVQHSSHQDGRRWGGAFCPLDAVYNFPAGLKEIQGYEKQIRGMQACLWTWKSPTRNRREFLIYPRLQALAEAAWTQPENKDYNRFKTYLSKFYLKQLKAKGISHASLTQPRFDITRDGKEVIQKEATPTSPKK